jgi:hypothetical protein
MIYIAAPYTHTDEEVINQRVTVSGAVAAALSEEGYVCYSPLVHCHIIHQAMRTKQEKVFWMRHCLTMLAASELMLIVPLEGWKTSSGIMEEAIESLKAGRPLAIFQPEDDDFTRWQGVEKISEADFKAWVSGIVNFNVFKPLTRRL